MQNVIIQMGIPLLTLDGKQIHRVKRFKLLCKACHRINKKIDNICCENCGNNTLCKVSVYINASGQVTYYKNPRRVVNLRGTKYSIPKPKGGRHRDLVFAEDQFLTGQKKYLLEK